MPICSWQNVKDLIGFIQQFMNRAASHLATRKEPEELYKTEDSYMQEGSGQGIYTC